MKNTNKNLYYIEYIRNRKDGKLNKCYSKNMRENKVQNYIDSIKNLLQCEILKKVSAIYYEKILEMDTRGTYKIYNREKRKFEEYENFNDYILKNQNEEQ